LQSNTAVVRVLIGDNPSQLSQTSAGLEVEASEGDLVGWRTTESSPAPAPPALAASIAGTPTAIIKAVQTAGTLGGGGGR
jgi:hypothetical protein